MVASARVLDLVKCKVYSLLSLNEHSDGILMNDFVSNYARYIGRPLNYPGLGFATLFEFISAIPDVARIKHSDINPKYMVVAMAARKSKFPKNVNSALLPLPRNAHSNPNSSISLDSEVEDLEPDRYGRYSLCVPRENVPDDMSDDDLKGEFRPSGKISDVHRTDRHIFIRFITKEELQSCLRMFGPKYGLRLGRQSSKKELSNENYHQEQHFEEPPMRNRKQGPQKTANYIEGPSGDADRFRDKGQFQNHSRVNNGRKSQASDSFHDMEDEEESSSTELFVSNIESKEDFEMAIQTYRPKHTKVIVSGMKKYAFVSMWNHEDAIAVIQDLNDKMQQTRRLTVHFNKEKHKSQSDRSSSMSDSCTDVGMPLKRERNHSSGARSKTKAPKENGQVDRNMPELESTVDVNSMPPLVADADVHDPDGQYDLNTSVLVTNFPPCTMESQLKAVFKGYRVMDICVLNNGYSNGCTRALVYMSTIYEAISAVTDEMGFEMGGCSLKVLPPTDNVLLKKILIRIKTGLRDWN